MHKQAIRRALPIVVLAILAAVAIVVLKSQKTVVAPKPPPAPPQIDYGPLIQTHTDQASRRNVNSLQSFELNVNRIIKEHEPKLQAAATAASKQAADYESCCAIVHYLAWDKVKKDTRTDAYLDSQIKPITDPAINALASDINEAVDRLDADLRRSTLLLAKDLAALGPAKERAPVEVDSQNLDNVDLDATLRNLGFNAAGLGVAVVFDAVAVCKTKIAGMTWKKIAAIAARVFGKKVAKVAASAAVAAADGPLPIGDIIAIAGLIWTGYDIYAGQKQFERELNTSLSNMLSEANTSIHKQAVDHANAMLKRYQDLQDNIGSQAATQLSGGQK